MSPKRLRCSVVGCNNEHSSCHLLLTSKPITFVFYGMCPLIYTVKNGTGYLLKGDLLCPFLQDVK